MHQTEWATKEWGVEICTIDSDFVQFFFSYLFTQMIYRYVNPRRD